MAQKQITDTTPSTTNKTKPLPIQPTPTRQATAAPKPLPQKIELTKTPTKQIPQEILILTRGLEEIEGIVYAMRQQILQLYGPVDYTSISDIELQFTEQQAKQLDFELIGENWIIKPKQYLDNFNDIMATVRKLGGTYTPATNQQHAHFKIKRA